MANSVQNGQTCLEKRGYEERHNEIARSDYNIENEYGATHEDALSNGDPQGKGTQHGGHSHYLPDYTKDRNTINYSNFDTFNGGGEYDIKGRNGISGRERSMNISIYRQDESAQYSALHKNALSDGDVPGKGTGHGGHGDWLPDCTGTNQTINSIRYSNFDTVNGGGKYDVEAREHALAKSMYNQESQYGPTTVDTTQNVNDGQYYFGQQRN